MPRRSPGDGTLFKRKDGLWVAGFTIDGKQHRVTAKNRNDAIAKRREVRWRVSDRKDLLHVRSAHRTPIRR